MRIGLRFARELAARGLLPRVAWVEADLYGSLALTGRGHGTDRAVVMGLMGMDPATVDPHAVAADVEAVRRCGRLPLAGTHAVDFDESHHLHFRVTEQLPEHPNGMRLHAFDAQGQELLCETMFSIGGGTWIGREKARSCERLTGIPTSLPTGRTVRLSRRLSPLG